MNQLRLNDVRVLAIAPSTRGFGFAVLEGPETLVDWGVRTVRGDKNVRCVAEVNHLIELYQPNMIVLENCTAKNSKRHERIRKLIRGIAALAKSRGIKTERFSRTQVRCAFSANCSATKEQIAEAIGERFPDELGSRLPPHRQPWMSEDYRMTIFDAVALALTVFHARCVTPERKVHDRGKVS
jgi:Holliday junction resolvasome RuvABC endonuclease subunit